jgi:chromosome segregation ATPase
MQIRSRLFSLVIMASLALSLSVIGSAQTKKKRSRRASKPAAPKPVITNPSIAPTTQSSTAGDVKIISTADQTQESESSDRPAAKTKAAASTPAAEQETMQQTITTLSNQVNRLSDKLSSMQEDDRYMVDMERLTRAEQRAEQLRSQLFDLQSKLADAQARLEQIEYALKPENIERTTQSYGTVHPEEAREARRKQLEGEKFRVTAQLNLYESGKNRLETSVASADSEVDLLRAKLTQRREQMDAASGNEARPATESRPRKP